MSRPNSTPFENYNFDRVYENGVLVGAYCTTCEKTFRGTHLDRLRKHYNGCMVDVIVTPEYQRLVTGKTPERAREEVEVNETPKGKRILTEMTPSGTRIVKKPRCLDMPPITSFMDKCSDIEAEEIKMQILQFALSTNQDLATLDHPEFQKLLGMIRPSFLPHSFSSFELYNSYVPKLYETILTKLIDQLGDQCCLRIFIDELNNLLTLTGDKAFIGVYDVGSNETFLSTLVLCVSFFLSIFVTF